jgi:hypothetical protein
MQKFFQSFLGKHENPLSKVSGGSGQELIRLFSLAARPLERILPRMANSVAQALTA